MHAAEGPQRVDRAVSSPLSVISLGDVLSDTTFPQLGILRVPPLCTRAGRIPPPNNSSSIGPSLELAATHLTGGTMSEEDTGQNGARLGLRSEQERVRAALGSDGEFALR